MSRLITLGYARRTIFTMLIFASLCAMELMQYAKKPLVLNPWNIEPLQHMERDMGKRVYTVLQLRLHPSIIEVKKRYQETGTKHDIDLTYITSRGAWYLISWKGDNSRSGGVATNIGVHFFDMLMWVFGAVQHVTVNHSTPTCNAGYMELERARVRWFLSVDSNDLPPQARVEGKRTYRSISIAGEEIEFSGGFEDLHTESYRQILAGNGYGLDDARASIEIVHQIRNFDPVGAKGEYHPFLKRVAS